MTLGIRIFIDLCDLSENGPDRSLLFNTFYCERLFQECLYRGHGVLENYGQIATPTK